jgi:hypothetical protein
MKVGHRIQKHRQCFAMSGFELLDEVLHVFTDELLCGLRLPVIAAGSRRGCGIGEGGGCTGCAVAVVCEFHCFSLRLPCGAFFLSPRSEAEEKRSTGRRGGAILDESAGPRGGRGKCQTRFIVWRAAGAVSKGRPGA